MAALKSDHTMTMWGNPYGGITSVPSGLNDITAISAGIFHTMALRSNGMVVSWGENSSGVDTTVPSGLNSVIAIAAGGKHSLALKSDGSIIAWGRNNEGQITIPVFPGKPVDIQAGAYFSVALIDDNLTLSASGVHGTISGAGIYQAGTTAVLTVAPSLGYIFEVL